MCATANKFACYAAHPRRLARLCESHKNVAGWDTISIASLSLGGMLAFPILGATLTQPREESKAGSQRSVRRSTPANLSVDGQGKRKCLIYNNSLGIFNFICFWRKWKNSIFLDIRRQIIGFQYVAFQPHVELDEGVRTN